MIKTEEFLLPAHWACYLINGDETGYTPAEVEEIQEWEIAHAPGPCIGCGDEAEFCWLGDDGVLGADRCTFTFQVIETCYSDGDIVMYH